MSTDPFAGGRLAAATPNPAAAGDLRIGVALPQEVTGAEFGRGLVQRFARRAERLGFDGLWGQESVRGPAATLEPLTLLGTAAAVTTRVELGVAVVLSAYRSPIQLARAAASLDRLSGERLVLGVGLGDRDLDPAFEIAAGERVTRFVEGIELMRRLWTQDRVTWQGLAGRLDDWPTGLRPARPNGPTIWLGGHHPAALRRAPRLGDGWIGAGGASSDQFLMDLSMLRDVLAASPPRAIDFGVGKRVYLAVGRKRAIDRRRLRDWFGHRYRDPDRADRVAIASDPPGLVEALAPLVSAGVQLLILNPLFDERRQLDSLAAEVVPHLRVQATASG